jgi:hypothetical protein
MFTSVPTRPTLTTTSTASGGGPGLRLGRGPEYRLSAAAAAHLRGMRVAATLSREGLEPGADPLAGSLFRVVVGVTGLPVREFSGA